MERSLWKTKDLLPGYPPLDGDVQTDVLIIGGGLAGILTAYELEQAGVNYLLIEADTLCSGVTGNTTAKVTSQHGLIYSKLIRTMGEERAGLYWKANEQAMGRIRQLAQRFSCDFETQDAYVYSKDRPDKLEREMKALERLKIPAQYEREVPLPFHVAGAVRFREQGQFHPLKFAAGLSKGLNIREHTTAISIKKGRVQTTGGTIKASRVIVTTHFPFLNKHGSYFMKLYQDRSYVLALERVPQMDGMYLEEGQGGLSFRFYGSQLLLGGGGHRTGKQGGGWAELEAAARRYYPDSSVRMRWATQDCMTLDSVAYIGQYSASTPELYVATGFNKWGMTTSMVAAQLLCDTIQGKENPYTQLYSPSRTMLRPQLLVNVGESAVNLLTPTVPRCPHMGCALKWNPQEHTWDCPCHGSRFSRKGKRLDNPAKRGLKR